MPRIKRWFPVSHDINRDPELWELRTKHGEKILACWLELLSIADRNDGEIPGTIEQVSSAVAWHIRVKCFTCLTYIRAITDAGWLQVNGKIKVANYAKYHRTQEHIPVPSEPDLTRPNRTRPKNKIYSVVPEFPADWQWLKKFVESQNGNFPKERFLDWPWWDAVSETCGGLSEEWLTIQFAGIKRWIMENPTREPTPKGYRRFVGGWLERSYNQERRFANGPTKKF